LAENENGTERSGTADDAEVLYAIETTLRHCHQDDERVDNAAALATLRSMVRNDPPTTMPHAWIFAQLVEARTGLHDVTGDTWNRCVLAVMDSVRSGAPRFTIGLAPVGN
jgi:hypothetical protein